MKKFIHFMLFWATVLSLNAQNNCSVSIGIDSTNTGTVVLVAYPNGSSPFTYIWSTGETTQSINWSPNNGVNYCVTVTDAAGCTATDCLYTTSPGNCNATISVEYLPGGTALVTGNVSGTPPLLFSFNADPPAWTSLPSAGITATAATSGTWCINVEDAEGCSTSACQFVQLGNQNSCDVWIQMDSVGSNVELTAIPAGTAPFSFLWNTGETTASVTWNPNGALYCVTVTDANGCEASSCFGTPFFCSVYIVENPAGGLTAFPNGSAPYSYLWNNGWTTQTMFPNAPGTYCVTIGDNNGCSSTACYQYTGGGGGNDSCGVYIVLDSVPPGANGWLLTAMTDGDAPFTYLWNVQNASTPSIVVAGPGYYCVTVTAADGCTAVDCHTIFANSCSVSILQEDSSGVDYLIPFATGSSPYTFLWNTGETAAVITPSTAGTYCVTMTDADGCLSSDCIYYDPLSGSYPFVIQGYIYLPDSINANAVDGFVELYQFDANGSLSLFSTVDIQTDPSGWSNHYNFGAVPQGQYLVKVNVDPNSPLFDDYVPTYYGNVELWNEATTINVPCNCNFPFYNVILIEDENLTGGGDGQITGTVTEGEGFSHGGEERGNGDPLAGVSILLYNASEQLIDHTMSDENGEYSFGNLPFGTYKLMVEITGIEQAERWVILSADNPISSGNDFEVTEEGIVNGLAELITENSFHVFPNPSKDGVNVSLETTGNVDAVLTLSTLTGQSVLTKRENLGAGKQTIQFDLSDLPTGIYFLQVSNGKEVMTQKLVKS